MSNYEYLLSDINMVKGIGPKITKLFKKKNINTIFDLLWSLPIESIDRSKVTKINELPNFHDCKVINTSPNFLSEIIKIRELDYYFTNSISRASKTMSECRQIKQDSKKTGTDN